MNSLPTENHRTRVAAERRERTRARLLQGALQVFSEKGPGAAVIDDVIALAGMSRGSFYNYFRTNEELLQAVSTEIGNELLRIIDPVVQQRDDTVARMACGTRLLLHTARKFPLLGTFLARLAWPAAAPHLQGIQFLGRDLQAGIEQGKFDCEIRIGIDLVMGTMFSAASSLAFEPLPDEYPEAMVKALLKGLGVKEQAAAKAVAAPLPEVMLQEDSILLGALVRKT